MRQVIHLAVDEAELYYGKGPPGLASPFDLALEFPTRHFRHEAGERQDRTRLRHAIARVDVEPEPQGFSGERLRQTRAPNEHFPA